MQSENRTLVPLAELLPEALANAQLTQAVRELAGRISWRGCAMALNLSLDATRMLGADASRCQRATRALARQKLAELAQLEKGAA